MFRCRWNWGKLFWILAKLALLLQFATLKHSSAVEDTMTLIAIAGDDQNTTTKTVNYFRLVLNSYNITLLDEVDYLPDPNSYSGNVMSGDIIYLVGGIYPAGMSDTFLSFNPSTHSWGNKPAFPHKVASNSLVVLDGKLISLGGGRSEANSTLTPYMYDLSAGNSTASSAAWTKIESNFNPPLSGACAVVIRGDIYYFGGQNLGTSTLSNQLLYSTDAALTWSVLSPMNIARQFAACVVLDGDRILVAGGRIALDADKYSYTNSTEIYTVSANKWHFAPDMKFRKNGASAVIIPNTENALVCGGDDIENFYLYCEVFDTTRNNWTVITQMFGGAVQPRTHFAMFIISSSSNSPSALFSAEAIGIACCVVLASLCIASMYWIRRKRRKSLISDGSTFHAENLVPARICSQLHIEVEFPTLFEQADFFEFDEKFEFPREKLVLYSENVLGIGEFGKVVLGEASGLARCAAKDDSYYSLASKSTPSIHTPANSPEPDVKVAVKIPRDDTPEKLKMLMSEAKVLMFIGHHVNVVNLLGVVSKNYNRGELLVMLEYCSHESLSKFLVGHHNDFAAIDDTSTMCSGSLKQSDLINFAYQLASGMLYLASRSIIHRDLAARNVLLTDDLVLKICDFGLACRGAMNEDGFVEYRRLTDARERKLPVKWTAPECFHFNGSIFSTRSDVWSYGITVWEIFALGEVPYRAEGENVRALLRKIMNGYRLNRPQEASLDLYFLMQECWLADRFSRPSFEEIRDRLSAVMQRDSCAIHVYAKLRAKEPYDYMHMRTGNSTAGAVTYGDILESDG